MSRSVGTGLLLATLATGLIAATPAMALADEPHEDRGTATGTTGIFLPPAGLRQDVQTTRVDQRPTADSVGGFQLSLVGGVQLRGSASGAAGVALAYFKRSTAAVGVEIEAAFTRGPSGRVYHGLASVILQSGARASRMSPYLTLGAGYYRAEEKLRDAVRDALPSFGIDPTEAKESGVLIAFGLGVRYYLAGSLSFRADYREFRAVTSAEGSLFDKLFSMRRIAGFLSIDF